MYLDEKLAMNEVSEDSFDERDCCYCDGDDCCGDDYDGHLDKGQYAASALLPVVIIGVFLIGLCATVTGIVFIVKHFCKTVTKLADCE